MTRDDQPPMGLLENWNWVLAEARAAMPNKPTAAIIAVQTYEIWTGFIGSRSSGDSASPSG